MSATPDDPTPPSPTLLALLPRLPSGPCLDLACGAGRNGLLLAQRGDAVEGWDRDADALARFRAQAQAQRLEQHVTLRQLDLEAPGFVPPPQQFRTVLVFRYLWRPLAPAIAALLAPSGALLYETFTDDPAGRGGPRNPEFRLRVGELPRLFPRLRVEWFVERIDADGHAVATLLARSPG